MRSLIMITLASAVALTACEQNPLGLGVTKTESFEEFVTDLEQDANNGVAIDWSQAEKTYAEYTAALPSASPGLTEAERAEQDALIGRWWAVRVKGMTLQQACDFLRAQGRRAEAFLEEIQR